MFGQCLINIQQCNQLTSTPGCCLFFYNILSKINPICKYQTQTQLKYRKSMILELITSLNLKN